MSSTAAPTPAAPVTPASCTPSTCGAMVMTVTDAAGDFLSYQVNLVSLQLQKADGSMVETLPATTAVDFAQLIDLSEILSARQIPPGDYVAAQVTVDYTNAAITVDDGTGNALAVKPVDSTGAALGQLQLMVQLDNKNHLQINAAKTSRHVAGSGTSVAFNPLLRRTACGLGPRATSKQRANDSMSAMGA